MNKISAFFLSHIFMLKMIGLTHHLQLGYIFEFICGNAQWALMHRFPSVCLSLYQKSPDNNSLEKNTGKKIITSEPFQGFFAISLTFDLKVKGHMARGQRSHGPRSN